MFIGNLAGEPIEIRITNNYFTRTTLNGEDKGFNSLSVRCYVPQSRLDEIMSNTKTTLTQEISQNLPSEEPNNGDEQSSKESPKTKKPQKNH